MEKMSKTKFTKVFNKILEQGFICMQSFNPNIVYFEYLLQKLSVRFYRKNSFIPEIEIKLKS